MLEDVGIFLVLADKVKWKSPSIPTQDIYLLKCFSQSLFAYHIEALVPSSPNSANTTQTPQKLNGSKDVHFFSVGNLGERTLVIFMTKKRVSCYPLTLYL
jgi:RHO1 GDP-GTP exchange protein 1/2